VSRVVDQSPGAPARHAPVYADRLRLPAGRWRSTPDRRDGQRPRRRVGLGRAGSVSARRPHLYLPHNRPTPAAAGRRKGGPKVQPKGPRCPSADQGNWHAVLGLGKGGRYRRRAGRCPGNWLRRRRGRRDGRRAGKPQSDEVVSKAHQSASCPQEVRKPPRETITDRPVPTPHPCRSSG
jgi:hypothetical protein